MNNKFKILIAILQIIVGILGAGVFVKNILNGGKIEMTVISLMLMILGLANGVRGIRNTDNNSKSTYGNKNI